MRYPGGGGRKFREETHSNNPDALPVINIARSYTEWIGGLVFALVSSTIPSMTFSGSCLG